MTTVKLFGDIGLSMDMKKTIDFTSKQQQLLWFNSKSYTFIDEVSYNKVTNNLHLPFGPTEKIRSLREAYSYTYAIVYLEEEETYYFCFVNDVLLVDNSTVNLSLTVDPFQTYMCEWTLDECLVNVAHVDRWTSSGEVARVTPNDEGVNGFVREVKAQELKGQQAMVVIACSDIVSGDYNLRQNVRYVVFPVDIVNRTTRIPTSIKIKFVDDTGKVIADEIGQGFFPSFDDVVNGKAIGALPVLPDSIISMSLEPNGNIPLSNCPTGGRSFKGKEMEFTLILNLTSKNAFVQKCSAIMTTDKNVPKEDVLIYQVMDADDFSLTNGTKLEPIKPASPVDGNSASYVYEPAMYMSPFMFRKVVNGYGEESLVIPDNITFTDKDIIYSKTYISATGVNNLIKVGDLETYSTGAEGGVAVLPSATLDLTTDAWKTYATTKLSSDRELVSNESWRSALDNVLFTSYGGALVGSRSASGKDDPYGKNGGKMAAGLAKFGSGFAGAVTAGAAVGVVSSMIDAHYAWEAQKIKERQIKNEPGLIKLTGDSLQGVIDGLNTYYYITLRVDDVSFNRAYERFRKYGYEINQMTKLNIRSRKYYNYVMTNGAIIRGSIPNSVKDELSTIFDYGVTIFHGDFANNLEYPVEENIERVLI